MTRALNSNIHPLFDGVEGRNKPQAVVSSERFDELWKMWPRREGKVLAKARYEAILAGCETRTLEKDSGTYITIKLHAAEDQIIKAAKTYIASQVDKNTYRMKDDGKFIPHLNTWLNKGKFLDYE